MVRGPEHPMLSMPATTKAYGLQIGTFTIMKYGAGVNGPMRTLVQYMLGSGATFG